MIQNGADTLTSEQREASAPEAPIYATVAVAARQL
jgi:hypothetical protein